MHFTSELLSKVPGVRHGFGTRLEPVPTTFASDWEARRPRWTQVHGTASLELLGPSQDCGQVDSLWTRKPATPLPVMTADCVPVLLSRRDGLAIAGAHAGWRGTRGRILQALWQKLAAQGEKSSDWVAAIGPSIGPCCYEVSVELAADFGAEFDTDFRAKGQGIAVPSHRHLDLPAINAAELSRIGIETDLLRACTKCSGPPQDATFHSFRREGKGTRQFSIIEINSLH